MLSRLIATIGLIAACGCDRAPFVAAAAAHPYDPPFADSAAIPRQPAPFPLSATARQEESTQALAARIIELQSRFNQELTPPNTRRDLPCPEALSGSTERTNVVVRIRDDRFEPQNLLPLDLRARLQSDEFARVGEQYVGGPAALWNLESARLKGHESMSVAGAHLDQLGKLSALVALHITSYSKPHVFRRKGVIRSEWDAGTIGGRLVVYDLERAAPLCQSWLSVRGDATGAPLRRRLREMTRNRLHKELLDLTWKSMKDKLAQLSANLEMPPEELRGRVSERW